MQCRICHMTLYYNYLKPGRDVCEDCRHDLCSNVLIPIGDIGQPATPYPYPSTGDPIPPNNFTTICRSDENG